MAKKRPSYTAEQIIGKLDIPDNEDNVELLRGMVALCPSMKELQKVEEFFISGDSAVDKVHSDFIRKEVRNRKVEEFIDWFTTKKISDVVECSAFFAIATYFPFPADSRALRKTLGLWNGNLRSNHQYLANQLIAKLNEFALDPSLVSQTLVDYKAAIDPFKTKK